MSNTNTRSPSRAVMGISTYPPANPVCARHGTSTTETGQRSVFARNTYVTPDSQEQVEQFYSQQYGQPIQQGSTLHWQQEMQNGHQHIVLRLTVVAAEEQQPNQRTLIKSDCTVISLPQQSV